MLLAPQAREKGTGLPASAADGREEEVEVSRLRVLRHLHRRCGARQAAGHRGGGLQGAMRRRGQVRLRRLGSELGEHEFGFLGGQGAGVLRGVRPGRRLGPLRGLEERRRSLQKCLLQLQVRHVLEHSPLVRMHRLWVLQPERRLWRWCWAAPHVGASRPSARQTLLAHAADPGLLQEPPRHGEALRRRRPDDLAVGARVPSRQGVGRLALQGVRSWDFQRVLGPLQLVPSGKVRQWRRLQLLRGLPGGALQQFQWSYDVQALRARVLAGQRWRKVVRPVPTWEVHRRRGHGRLLLLPPGHVQLRPRRHAVQTVRQGLL
mmetsp:Transcript_81401/g.225422  ORF Transcript_81401/g.225422 Transcript_81401/m.225422 type:complete len:319 (-) Transcript_81401:1049-2005(-)